MSRRIETLIILGAGGDLTRRLLLPGLGSLLDAERISGLQVIGAGQDDLTESEWRDRVAESFKAGGATGEHSAAVASTSTFVRVDATSAHDLAALLETADGSPALYFALPPSVTVATCDALAGLDLPTGTVLALEKPFGTDLHSARALNRRLATLLPENQVHRIDHFLGKSTVLNLLGLRFANRVFEPVWNADNVESVDIVFDEQLALEGRAGYYDRAGALVDMIQSHLLIVMALMAMEAPSSLDADDLRGAMAQVLRATRVQGDDAGSWSRRARYTAGALDGRDLPAYVDEQGVDPARNTETLAEVVVGIDNWRWSGVPFRLRSGKAIGSTRKEIVIHFRDVPHLPVGFIGDPGPSALRITLGPDEISLDLNINGEGDPFTLERVSLDVRFGAGALPPYGEVIDGLLSSDPTLSLRADVVEECWRIVDPVLRSWRSNAVPLEQYPAGSQGPDGWPL